MSDLTLEWRNAIDTTTVHTTNYAVLKTRSNVRLCVWDIANVIRQQNRILKRLRSILRSGALVMASSQKHIRSDIYVPKKLHNGNIFLVVFRMW